MSEEQINNKEEVKAIKDKIKKLILIENDLIEKNKCLPITRLLVIKGLCKNYKAKCAFARYISEKAYERALTKNLDENTNKLFIDSLKLMEQILDFNKDSEKIVYNESSKKELFEMHNKLYKYQDQGKSGHYGIWIRSITNNDLLIVEEGVECFLKENDERIGYEICKHYVEEYNPLYGTGIIPESLPSLRDIIEFWKNYYKDLIEISEIKRTKTKRVSLKIENIIIGLKEKELKEFITYYSKKDLKFKKEFINYFKKKEDS